MLRPVESGAAGFPLQPTAPSPENLAVDGADLAAVTALPTPSLAQLAAPVPDGALPRPRDGSGPRDLVDEWAAPPSVRGASPGPDGAHAFVGDRDGPPELWIRSADGTERTIDTGPGQVRSVLWSPDGAHLAVVVAPGGGERTEVHVVRPDGTGLRRLAGGAGPGTSEPTAATAVRWLGGGRLLLITESVRSGLTHALAVDLAGRRRHLAVGLALQVCAVHEGFGAGAADAADAPDDRWLLLLREGPRGARRVLMAAVPAPVPSAAAAASFTVPGGTVTAVSGTFSPDGSRALLACDLGRERSGLLEVVVRPDGTPGAARLVAGRADADLERLALIDATTAVLSWNVGGRSELALLDLGTGASHPLPSPPREVVTALRCAPDGASLVLELAGSTAPGEVWTFDLGARRAGGEAGYQCLISHTPTAYPTVGLTAVGVDGEPAARSAEAGGYRLVSPVCRHFRAHDGLELTGWWYRPQVGPGPLPTVLYFHGGPEAQERPVLNPLFHALLARGIAVFAPNVRGSTGFGRSFEEADHRHRRFAGIADVESAVAYLVDEGLAAAGRIGVAGRSYGGYLTLAALVSFPALFAVGVDVCGMVDLETFYEHTEPWIAAPAVTKYGDPATDRELLRALSPLHRMDALVAPLMVVHGDHDTNVPLCEAEQTVAAARARGVPCEYLLFEGEGHEVAHRANRLAFVRAVVDFVAARLVGAEASELLGAAEAV
ncbi:dipeptidyl aminopeptidase/acylaminoacyl peptidase [Frankia sp. EI5c]|uniref:S9 family peptidase n=1 Tax=Frankia sp. EI5c TaxID=683316 RepID=UPI0007C26288|nr:LpqB family beta-propeller domain-containing protein [Frankia sp. EI5c]OAA25452.1 dipeptidyl aminopeptidase/acylaminoacyl peptidase [Frankia sp. EI5c]